MSYNHENNFVQNVLCSLSYHFFLEENETYEKNTCKINARNGHKYPCPDN